MDRLVRRIDAVVFAEGDPQTISYISPIVSSIRSKYSACYFLIPLSSRIVEIKALFKLDIIS